MNHNSEKVIPNVLVMIGVKSRVFQKIRYNITFGITKIIRKSELPENAS